VVEGADDPCIDPATKEEGEHEWEVDADDPQPTTDSVTKDRHGKPIKHLRYMKTLYGVLIEGKVRCAVCGAEAEFSASGSEQASGFNELV
jgi:hypothetical protein